MPLILRITSYQRLTPGQDHSFTLSTETATIGRSANNDWVIPDPQRFLSGTHCQVEQRGNDYFLTDLSTNGVFVNGSDARIDRNSSVAIGNGDRFRIGDYEFEVAVEDADVYADVDTPTESFSSLSGDDTLDPFADLSGDDPPAPAPVERESFESPVDHLENNEFGQGMDINALLDLDDDEEESAPEPEPPSFSPIEEPMETPRQAASSGAQEIPDNWDEATGMFVAPSAADGGIPDDWDEGTGTFDSPTPVTEPEPEPTPTPPPPPPAAKPPPAPEPPAPKAPAPTPAAAPAAQPSRPAAAGGALEAFARGAGLEPSALNIADESAFFEEVGRMALSFTDGIMRALSGRASVKNEFRLDQTMIRPRENNPLKFSPLAGDALLRLLKHSDQAYLKGDAAVRESFEDINAHQIAVMAGMEAALQGMLEKFAPEALEKRLVSNSVLDNILPGAKKAKYWDIFTLEYRDIASDAEDDFQQVFGNEFSRAYEEQLERLKNNRKEST